MIKITLKDGVIVEVESAQEVLQILGHVKPLKPVATVVRNENPIKYNGACKICGKLIPKGTRRVKMCGAESCRKAYGALLARKYNSDPVRRAKKQEYQRRWLMNKRIEREALAHPENIDYDQDAAL